MFTIKWTGAAESSVDCVKFSVSNTKLCLKVTEIVFPGDWMCNQIKEAGYFQERNNPAYPVIKTEVIHE